MSSNDKRYWKGIEEYRNDLDFVKHAEKEFATKLPEQGKGIPDSDNPLSIEALAGSRRDFLKVMGFSLTAATLAACETPVRKAVPLLNRPEGLNASIPNYYASSYAQGGDFCSILVKTREGRPIKIEGNILSPVSKGGTGVKVQASVLNLYDTERFKDPMVSGSKTTWQEVDKIVIEQLNKSLGRVAVVSNTQISPSAEAALKQFSKKYNADYIVYDANSVSALKIANKVTFGVSEIPAYDFSKAKSIVSIGADFLGTWLSHIEFSKQFAQTRKLGKDKKDMSKLFAFEYQLSLTGANADRRVPIKPSMEGLVVASLYNEIAKKTGAPIIKGDGAKQIGDIESAAEHLLANKGKGIVVSGSNDPEVQVLVNAINNMLGNYGSTITFKQAYQGRKGDDATFIRFVNDLEKDKYQTVIFWNANPVYDTPAGAKIAQVLKGGKVFAISTSDRPDETTQLCNVVAPDNHYLESWGDALPYSGKYHLVQPAISPLFNSRQAPASFLKWSGTEVEYYDYVTAWWKKNIFPLAGGTASFQTFWNKALHDGFVDVPVTGTEPNFSVDLLEMGVKISQKYKSNSNTTEFFVYEKVGTGTGKDANNPWLLEFFDPISRACWENYFTIPFNVATELGIDKMKEGMHTFLLKVKIGGKEVVGPALIQPGQAKGTIGLALGFGRKVAGKAAKGVGVDAFELLSYNNQGLLNKVVSSVEVSNTGEPYSIAHVQTHHTIMGRPIVQESTLEKYQKDPAAGRYIPKLHTNDGGLKKPTDISLWSGHATPNHNWGMNIDLNSCIGCGACTIACQAENNIPTVGKEEVINRREMAWIRIDRYYSSAMPDGDFKELEKVAENPAVVFQPMMCQHCQNAPCETVCPVVATTHSTEGLNQMTYNRCVGTRYCANNCPFKVRRFNWFSYYQNEKFDYNLNNDLGRMVLNPDVTVRARGVMEKCSMCVQRIQEGKLVAKKEGRRPMDGEIKTACQQACSTDAIIFGDMNDPKTGISELLNEEGDKRAYHLLEEINVRPNVSYLTKIRNHDNVNNKEA